MGTGYVDIHTHILPGVDDGSKNWDMTEAMLRQQLEQGVTDIIATPHFDMEDNYQDPENIRALVAEANERAQKLDPKLTIYPGNEVLYTPGVVEAYEKGHILTLADSKYLLVEFFPTSSYKEIQEAITGFTRAGVTPVIAHVERYQCLFDAYDRLFEIGKMGAELQMNSRSLMGGLFDKRARVCRRMAQNGFIRFLGSDCHDDKSRVPRMQEAYKVLQKLGGNSLAQDLTESHARYILRGEYL